MSEFPSGWGSVNLFEICRPRQWKTISTRDLLPSGYVVYGANGEIGFYSEYTHENPTVMITCRGATCGNIHISKPFSYINGNAMALDDLNESISGLMYVNYFLRSRGFEDVISGSAQPQITGEGLRKVSIPIAPLPEQKRIADKLDAVLARVDACRDRLDNIPAILKRFHQSVLAAATSGKLTEEWRSANLDTETGLDVIALDAKSKTAMLKKDESLAKKKSSANSEVDESYTFELPEQWAFTSWGKMSEWITYGFTRPMPSTSEGMKLVTAKDVLNFMLRIGSAGYTTEEAFLSLSDKDRPQRGDLLITKDGTIGRAALVSTDEQFCINQSVAVCWLRSTSMNKRFLELIANTEFTQRFVFEKSKGMAIQHLSIIDFAQCPIPVPPLKEQDEIVRRVDSLFSYADLIEARYVAARDRVEKLTPSTLAKAFRGELVPQDPNDEPASTLLERIRAQRDGQAATAKPKRGRKIATISES